MSDAGGAISPRARIARTGPLRSRRLLALSGDSRLVEQIRRGNEAAFEVVFERHAPAILAFCRHMLGSPEEAEDAVQHAFAAAYRDLRRGDEREFALKPWLFAIARNRCMSLLRARRELPVDEADSVPTEGLAEQVERRAELRRVLADVRELPDEQRAALLLTEVGDLSHAEVADVLGCEGQRVKALVFRARSQLIARREARETPCEEIRAQLATLRGGALRRTELRLHLRDCPGCRVYREEVRRQRQMLAAALPVVPSVGLKSSVLAAAGLSGSAGGAATVAGAVGGATLAKVAVVGALAGGGLVAGDAVVDSDRPTPARPAPAQVAPDAAGADPAAGDAAGASRPSGDGAESIGRPLYGRTRGQARERGSGRERGRGPIEAPPGVTPVRRGPPEKAKPEKAEKDPTGANANGKARQAPRGNEPPARGGTASPGARPPEARGEAAAPRLTSPPAGGTAGRTGTSRRKTPAALGGTGTSRAKPPPPPALVAAD